VAAAYNIASLAEDGGLSIGSVAAALDKFGGINSDAVNDFFTLSALTKSSPRLAIKMIDTLKENGFTVKDVERFTELYSGDVGDDYRTKAAFVDRRDISLLKNPSKYDVMSNGGVMLSGNVYDRRRRRFIGTFARTIKRMPDGSIDVWHNLLTLGTGTQGGGFGRAYYQETEKKYLAAGINSIRLHADLDVGGYAWARMGYDFADDKTRDRIVKSFEKAHIEKYGTPPPKKLTRSWEIAEYETPDGVPFGKQFMLKSNWWGVKRVDPNSEGWQVGLEYYRAGQNHG